MREVKTIKCNGDVIRGDIFEVVDKNDNAALHFRIDEMVGSLVQGGQAIKKIRLRYRLEEMKELRSEIDDVIKRMEQEL